MAQKITENCEAPTVPAIDAQKITENCGMARMARMARFFTYSVGQKIKNMPHMGFFFPHRRHDPLKRAIRAIRAIPVAGENSASIAAREVAR